MYAIQFAAERRRRRAPGGPDHPHPGRRFRRAAHERRGLRQLLRAARHAPATTPPRPCCRRALHALLTHPDQLADLRADPSLTAGRGRGDPALGQPAALLPPHRHRRHGRGPDPHRRRATRWRCTTPRPTATRPCSPTRRPSTSTAVPTRTFRSASPSTSAWACTWPAWKDGCSSTSCSPPSTTSSSTGDPVHLRSNLNNAYR